MPRLRSAISTIVFGIVLPLAACSSDRWVPRPLASAADSAVMLPRPPDTVTSTPIAATDSIGPIAVSGRFFTVLLQREQHGADDHVRRMQIRDERGVAHYDEQFDPAVTPAGLEWTVGMRANAVRGEHGQGLALYYEYLPSAPMSGVSLRLFGLVGARLLPLAPALTMYGSFGELQPSREPNVEFLLPGEQLEIEIWQGYFGTIVPLRVQLTGCDPSAQSCVQSRPPRVDAASGLAVFRVRTNQREMMADTSVLWFAAPEGKAIATLLVTRGTDVEAIEVAAEIVIERDGDHAIVGTRREWLHVRIGTREGWIRGEQAGALGWVASG